MAIKDIKLLFNKRYRVFLILIIWFIIGFTFLDYNISIPIPNTPIIINGVIIFTPLLIICIALFLVALLFRAELIGPTKATLIKLLIMIVIIIVISTVIGTLFLEQVAYILFILATYSFIFITLAYLMFSCYNQGVKLDDKIRKIPNKKKIRFLIRLGIFLGGLIVTLVGINLAIILGGGTQGISNYIPSAFLSTLVDQLPIILIWVYLGFGIFVIVITLIFKKFNAWMGVYFMFTSLYAITILIDTFLSTGAAGSGAVPEIVSVVGVYIFDLFIIFFTMSGFMGEKAQKLESTLKVIADDAIIVWLIFAKASFEFAQATLGGLTTFGLTITALKSLSIFVLFIPLLVLIALVGMIKYQKKS